MRFQSAARALLLVAGASALPACGAPARSAPAAPLSPALATGEHRETLNGVPHWYRVAGTPAPGTPPVVFLHGGPGQGSVHFAALAGPHLEESLRMVYFDQRGSGRSEKPADGEYSIELLVEDLEALRRTLGVERMALLGQSFGGTLALEYAARYPERVSHLVFVAGLWDTAVQCALRLRTLQERRPEAYARTRADTLAADGRRRDDCDLEFRGFTSGEERERYNQEAMFPDAAVAARMDSVQRAHGYRNTGELGGGLFRRGLPTYRFTRLERVTMPVLVVAGRHDGAARPEGLRELASRLPNARFVEYERSGHFVYLDEPERFAREVAEFVRTRR